MSFVQKGVGFFACRLSWLGIKLRQPLRQQPEDGVIAIFIAIILGLLFVITTTSAARLQLSELNQASQIDRSEQAYYAAEAGIEEALLRIKNNPTGTIAQVFPEQFASCASGTLRGAQSALQDSNGNWIQAPVVSTDCGATDIGQLAWRDRQVYQSTAQLSGTQVKDESTQFDMSDIRRHMPTGTFGADGKDVDGSSIFSHLTGFQYCWTPNKDNPEIELTVISWDTSNINGSTSEKFIVQPFAGSGPMPQQNVPDGALTTTGGNPYADCLNFSTNSSRRYIMRVKPLFTPNPGPVPDSGTSTQNSFSINYQASLTTNFDISYPLYMPNNSTLIDVTGQSGDIRRRLVAEKLQTGRLIGVFDFVLYSGSSNFYLCKAGVQQPTSSGPNTYNADDCQVTNP